MGCRSTASLVAVLVMALTPGVAGCTDGGASTGESSVVTTRAGRGDGSAGGPTATTAGCRPPPPAPTTWARFSAPPDPASVRGRTLRAVLTTTCGELELELDGAAAPHGVASFVRLARTGWWRDSVCHRLTSRTSPLRFLQCGDPTGHDVGDPGYDVPPENVPADGRYRRGMLAGARGDGSLRSGSAQFLLVYADFTVPAGRPRYPVLGRVSAGLGVVDAVAAHGGEDTRPDGPPFRSVSVVDVVVRDP